MSGLIVELSDGEARAVIAHHGAELLSWRVGYRDLMWTPDPVFWDRVSPILFPVVGWCRDAQIRVGGESYPMGVHGFAAQCEFEIAGRETSSVSFLLRDNHQTRTSFPFAFELTITYRLHGHALFIELNVRNTGAIPLPYACGVHPGFLWHFAGGKRDEYRIELERAEKPEVPVIAPGGLFSLQQRRGVDFDGKTLHLSDALFAQEALCFLDVRSDGIVFIAPGGDRITVNVQNFPHLALWSKPGAPFICIEAWTGHGDPVGFEGDIFEKPSMITLGSNEARSHAVTFAYSAAR